MKKGLRILSAVLLALLAVTAFVACQANGDGKSGDESGYYIEYKGTKIELDKKADPVISALGEPKSKESLVNCGGYGTQIKYVYDDIVLYTVKNDSGETVDQITFSNDIAETPKGVCIGDPIADVEAKHGEPIEKSDTKLIYGEGSLFIKFGIKDGYVDSIDYIRETPKN